jgi:hypothetical protein
MDSLAQKIVYTRTWVDASKERSYNMNELVGHTLVLWPLS